jgi:hypothetical protein
MWKRLRPNLWYCPHHFSWALHCLPPNEEGISVRQSRYQPNRKYWPSAPLHRWGSTCAQLPGSHHSFPHTPLNESSKLSGGYRTILVDLRKITKPNPLYSDFNTGPPNYQARVLSTQQRYSVHLFMTRKSAVYNIKTILLNNSTFSLIYLTIRVSLAFLMTMKLYSMLVKTVYWWGVCVWYTCIGVLRWFHACIFRRWNESKHISKSVLYRRNEDVRRCRKHILELCSHFNDLNIVSNILRGWYRTY